jgi:hypothetical protein
MRYRIRTNGSTFEPQWSRFGIVWTPFSVQTGAETMGVWQSRSQAEAQAYIDREKENDRRRQWRTI